MTPATPHPADRHDQIRVIGARQNNLKNIAVAIPKRRLTVFTGISGSGKSSLVFGTIAAESQRLINETYSTFLQGFMPSLSRPDVDVLDGLTPAIVVGQERMGQNVRSTVGTATDVAALLRLLFSRLGQPHIGGPNAFSFNVPSVHAVGSMTVDKAGARTEKRTFSLQGGMCPRCEGMGHIHDIALDALYDANLSLNAGALTIPGFTSDGWHVRILAAAGLDPDKRICDYTAAERAILLDAEPTKVRVAGANLTHEGLRPRIQKTFLSKDIDTLQPHVRAFVERAVTFATCPDCAGTRLNATARSSKIRGLDIASASAMQISDLADWLQTIDDASVAPLVARMRHILDAFVAIGLGYLSLDRPTGTLSGGESQRTRMVGHLGSALTDVTYVFDEPTIGLHPHDIARLKSLLLQLRDKGNTVLVVEHKPEVIALADHVVDLGPGAGRHGGQVIFEGTVAELARADTPTGRHLAAPVATRAKLRKPQGTLAIRGASTHNLKNVDVDIPLGVLVAVTGVAGSGKSSLIHGSVAQRPGVVVIDQAPIRGSRRSNPATWTGLLEPVRKAFAKAHGVKPALFSANSEGACPTCAGNGFIETDLGPMASVTSRCEDCEGRRFQPAVLAYRLNGLDISKVFELAVSDAVDWFGTGESRIPAAHAIVKRLAEVGLGYVTLGQPLTTLSGGERQRLKLAAQMGEPGDIYVLDEPTTGLHPADLTPLLALLDRLVDSGRSVIVIEHHLAVMAHADWLIDLGPGAGHDGGRIVFEGPPAELAAKRNTLTGEHLAATLATAPIGRTKR
jgi:excinuclease UvrABC ATPase subunit